MAISFSCPQCGKKLKAPDDAAGKSSKCPGCGSAVTCPEPVYDAELVDPAHGPNPFDDLDGGEAYAVTAEPAEAPPGEARKPCPMCGEMIVATAAKCRFCGEVFDPTLKKASRGGKTGRLQSIASSQKKLLICILLQILTYSLLLVLSGMMRRSPDPALSLVVLCDAAVLLAAGVGGIIYTFLLSTKIYNTGLGIVLALLTIVPCLGLLILLMVNQRATAILQENGYRVGLLGAKAT
jgi:predicted RNA-binding Zn-ribbon protein involved in translation (DUF1610 family)